MMSSTTRNARRIAVERSVRASQIREDRIARDIRARVAFKRATSRNLKGA